MNPMMTPNNPAMMAPNQMARPQIRPGMVSSIKYL